jgi:DNA polymerase
MEVVSGCIRHFIHTKPGTDFIAADYSSIEARVNCYLADQRHAIKLYQKDLESQQRFQNGEISAEQRKKEKWALDQYVDMAGAVYKIDNIEVTDAHRDLGKCIILGCGFGMGKKTFYETCLNWGLNISKELAGQSVDAYRAKYYNIVKFWYKVEELAIKAIKTGKVQKYQQIQFAYKFGYLFIKLPSGRTLSYPKAYLKPTKTSWGEMKETIHFYGNIKGTLWGTVTTYGGKLVENIVQGASRDIMAHGMLNAEKAGYPPIGTVHDEGITEVNLKFGSVTEYERLLCDLPDWAKGMPIAAEGFRDIMYQK